MQTTNGKTIEVRPYIDADYTSLREIYRSSIQQLGLEHYSAEQVRAWAGYADDNAIFSGWLSKSSILMAVDERGTHLGFAGLERPGRISALFVAPDSTRQGVASMLIDHLLSLDPVQKVYTAEASEFSKGTLEKFGFKVTAIEHTRLDDVSFTRYAMQKNT